MSIFFRLIFCCLFFNWAQAQTASEWALKKACTCLEQQQTDSSSILQLENIGDSCITVAVWQNIGGLLAEFRLDMKDSKAMEQAGKELGVRLSSECSSYQRYSKRLAWLRLADPKGFREKQKGLLINLSMSAQPPYFSVLDSSGQVHQFHWLREFDGSARFFKGVEAYQSTEVEVIWQATELFDPLSKQYKVYQEIFLLEELKQLSEEDRQKRYLSKLPQEKGKKPKKGKKKKN